MSLINLITEGRKENFIQKFSSKFNQEQLDKILEKSESIVGRNKFLDYMGKVVNPRNFTDDLNIVTNLLTRFATIGSNLPIKDINQYKTMSELKKALSDYDNKVRREIKTVDDADIVYEDDKMIVVMPKTYKASCQFGSGTKWCTTSSPSYYEKYNEDAKLFYFIDKTKPTSDPTYKVALLQKFNGDRTYFNAVDDSFKTGWIFGTEKLEKILSQVMSYLNTTYAEQIKIWGDKERAEKERERLNAERERNRRLAIQQEQERKRQENEWDLDDCMDCETAQKAHAVFNYLINQNELDPLTQEDIRRLQAAREELDELKTIYDNTDNANELTDLSNRISELETEISVLEDKKDIYFLVEYGEHYGLTTFDYEGTIYAVGTDTESEDAAKSAAESLIEDIGIEGFNSNFVENYIDEDEVFEVIIEFFNHDVYDSPESYLDDEDRELSGEQDSEIEKLMEEWRALEKKTEQTDDDDELQEIYNRVGDIRDEIDEIKENPEGDYDEDKIEQMIEIRANEYKNRLEDFFTEYYGVNYLEWVVDNRLVNINELIDGVVEADGYGVCLNTYDHSYETEEVSGTYYNIFRLN
jgi:hypothetical protein